MGEEGGRRTEDGGWSTEFRVRRTEGTEDGVQSTDYRGRRAEDRGWRGFLGDRLFPLLFGAIGAGEEGDGWDEGDG
jgi:hypothetical protein